MRSTIDFQQLTLAPNYRWWDWRNDPAVDRELKRFHLLIETKFPALLDAQSIDDDLKASDCLFQGARAIGLGIAHRMDALAVSLPTSSRWDCPLLAIEVHELQDNKIEVRQDKVRHASHPSHVGIAHREWMKRRLESLVRDGAELWRRRGQLFVGLDFCDSVRNQMELLPMGVLPRILRVLFHLNDYARSWNVGGFECDQVECNVSPESSSTIEQFGDERTFGCPNGSRRVFSWHAKVGEWRVYFDPADGPGRLLIGYVGKHLRTKKFR